MIFDENILYQLIEGGQSLIWAYQQVLKLVWPQWTSGKRLLFIQIQTLTLPSMHHHKWNCMQNNHWKIVEHEPLTKSHIEWKDDCNVLCVEGYLSKLKDTTPCFHCLYKLWCEDFCRSYLLEGWVFTWNSEQSISFLLFHFQVWMTLSGAVLPSFWLVSYSFFPNCYISISLSGFKLYMDNHASMWLSEVSNTQSTDCKFFLNARRQRQLMSQTACQSPNSMLDEFLWYQRLINYCGMLVWKGSCVCILLLV